MRSKEITKGFDEIRQLLRENALEAKQRAQEAEQRFQRIEQQREKNAQEAEQRYQRIEQQREKNAQEAEQRYQRIEQILENNAQELQGTRKLIEGNAEQIKANAEQMRETDRKIKELTNLFTGQWGKLIEALIKPGSLKLFQDRGINVQKRKTRMAERLNGGRHMEIDTKRKKLPSSLK